MRLNQIVEGLCTHASAFYHLQTLDSDTAQTPASLCLLILDDIVLFCLAVFQ